MAWHAVHLMIGLPFSNRTYGRLFVVASIIQANSLNKGTLLLAFALPAVLIIQMCRFRCRFWLGFG